MRFPLRNNIVIPNNSLLSRKYLHHEICNRIERSAEVSGKETAVRLARRQIAFMFQKV